MKRKERNRKKIVDKRIWDHSKFCVLYFDFMCSVLCSNKIVVYSVLKRQF